MLLPPGTKFSPTDQELLYILVSKATGHLVLPPNTIHDVDVYSTEPWNLPAVVDHGTAYFYTPRWPSPTKGRAKRAAGSGFWHGKSSLSPITACGGGSGTIGCKASLTFKKMDKKTWPGNEWIMHEYLLNSDEDFQPHANCRIYKKVIKRGSGEHVSQMHLTVSNNNQEEEPAPKQPAVKMEMEEAQSSSPDADMDTSAALIQYQVPEDIDWEDLLNQLMEEPAIDLETDWENIIHPDTRGEVECDQYLDLGTATESILLRRRRRRRGQYRC